MNKNDIACLKASCKTLNTLIGKHPRLEVDNIQYEFWGPLLEKLINDEGGCYGGDKYCVFIESIDRGVMSFTTFAKRLKEAYPNIKELDFEQNYSWLSDQRKGDWISVAQEQFIEFINYLRLTYLKIEDSQSAFFRYFEWGKIFDAMPERSEYVVLCDTGGCDCDCYCYGHGSYRDYMGKECFKIIEKGTKRLVLHCDSLNESDEESES